MSDFQLDLFFGLGHALLRSLFQRESGKNFAKARIASERIKDWVHAHLQR